MSYTSLAQMYDVDSASILLTQENKARISLQYETNINTELWEYSPIYYSSGVAFIGSRKDKDRIDYDNKTPFFTIRFAETSKTGKLELPRAFGPRTSVELHEGPLDFTADGDTMYYTLSVPTEEGKDKIPLQIHRAVKGAEYWENIGPLDFISPEFSYAHPTLKTTGDELVFTAKLGDSQGGMDLYISKKVNGVWMEPENLGPNINSRGNELFPRLHPSGILFYASDGLGKGKNLDIYFTYKVNGEYRKPLKLREPFNSDGDDFGIIFDKNGENGYFTSSRKGTKGKDDILSFKASEALIPFKTEVKNLEVIVQDEVSRRRLMNATIHLVELDENGLIFDKNFYDTHLETGDNEIQIKLKLKNPTEFPTPLATTDINGMAEVKYLAERPLILIVAKEGYRVEQIELAKLEDETVNVKLKYDVCINLEIVTQNEKNEKIPAHVKLISDCDTETHIPGELGEGIYEACLQPDCFYTIITSHAGYESDTIVITASGSSQNAMHKTIRLKGHVIVKDIEDVIPKRRERDISAIENMKAEKPITLRKIYYDFNKSSIRTGAAEELDALAELMLRYPSMEIELNAHTDSRGSEIYNLELSLQRARSAKLYLVNKGVESARIRAVGYGESIPLNHCVDGVECTEEEHQYNRRTEVRILSDLELNINKIDNPPQIIDKRRSE